MTQEKLVFSDSTDAFKAETDCWSRAYAGALAGRQSHDPRGFAEIAEIVADDAVRAFRERIPGRQK